jgi:predicted dehydrogenase
MKKIGFMGCGVIATHGHLPAILETPGLDLTSVYDPDPVQLSRFRERYPSATGYTNSDAFLRSGIDAVAITSPAPRHLENVRDAARYGLDILCEKPLAMQDGEIVEMIRIAREAKLTLAAAFCYRFSPVALRIKDLVANGAIGQVRALRLIYNWDLHGRYEIDENGGRILSPRRVGRMLEGGPMVDCGVHQMDLARWWTGSEYVRYQASGAWIEEEFEAPDHMWLNLDHENGTHTAVEMSFSYTHTAKEPLAHFSYHLIGTDGLIRYDRDNWHFEMRTPHGTEYMQGASEKNFTGMYHAWRDALESGIPGDLPSAEDGLLVTRIARAATEKVIAVRAGVLDCACGTL